MCLTVLVVHEAWWFDAQRSPWYEELPEASKPVNLGRLALLTGHGLCLYRCHSNWDARPGDGVADRIGPALGLERESPGGASRGCSRCRRSRSPASRRG